MPPPPLPPQSSPTGGSTSTPSKSKEKFLSLILKAIIMMLLISFFFLILPLASFLLLLPLLLRHRRHRHRRHHLHPSSGFSWKQLKKLPQFRFSHETESVGSDSDSCVICLDGFRQERGFDLKMMIIAIPVLVRGEQSFRACLICKFIANLVPFFCIIKLYSSLFLNNPYEEFLQF
ncbi:hypothetical protein V6Z11_A08G274900 [Gossypium hirsutum]